MLCYVNRSKIKKKSLIVVTSFIILLLIYFTVIDIYIISIHDNYKIAATSFATITSRASLTLFLAMYYIESILTYNPEYICGSNGKLSSFDYVYEKCLYYEQNIIEDQKSTKRIYKEYNKILEDLNSESFCLYSDKPERNINYNLSLQ